MVMQPPPPLAEVAEKFQTLVVPAAGAAALVAACAVALSRRLGGAAGALGVAAGVAFANWGAGTVPWRPDPEHPQGFQAVLPGALVVAILGLLPTRLAAGQRRWPLAVGWLVRFAVLTYLAGLLTPKATGSELATAPGLALIITLLWYALDRAIAAPDPTAERRDVNRGAEAVAGVGLALTLSSGVMLYGHIASFCDLATAGGAALAGAAAVCAAARVTGRGALGPGLWLLASLAYAGAQGSDSLVPKYAYALPVVATAALALFGRTARLWPRRTPGWALRLGLVVAVAASALVLAGRVEQLPWEESWDEPAPTKSAGE